MAYNQFTLQKAITDFGLTVDTVPDLFPGVSLCMASSGLRAQLQRSTGWATLVNTEAARTQFLVSPLLHEFWERSAYQVAMYAGTRFDVEEAAGLVGVCDFVLGYPPQLNFIAAPILMIVEAKNENIWGGVGQCAAELVAAQRFNATHNPEIRTVYGASTDGSEWRFLRLCGQKLDIDFRTRMVADPDTILGILFHICGITPATPAAA